VIIDEIIAGYAAIVATAAVIFQIRQTRRARKPQIELELIISMLVRALETGVIESCRVVTLEVRNRGDHPIRIVEAGITSPRTRYIFWPQNTQVINDEAMMTSGSFLTVAIDTLHEETENSSPPLPGIILPRDSASRWVSSCMMSDENTAKVALDIKNKYRHEIDISLKAELFGWVKISTGEFVKMKPARLDWENFGGSPSTM
jgi:hypothetical protein